MAFAGISQTKTGFDWKQEADPASPFFMAEGIWAGRMEHPQAVLGRSYSQFRLSQNHGMMRVSWDGRDWDEMGFESKAFHDSMILSLPAWSCHWVFSILAMCLLAEIPSPLPAGRSFLRDILELFSALTAQLNFLAIPESQP